MTLKESRKFTVSIVCLVFIHILNCKMTLFFAICFFLYFRLAVVFSAKETSERLFVDLLEVVGFFRVYFHTNISLQVK